jgi:hypothetical protein
MKTEGPQENAPANMDIRPFKETLRKRLPPESPVLKDLLDEPDSMPVTRAEVLIPHYLQRLERTGDELVSVRRSDLERILDLLQKLEGPGSSRQAS